MSGRQVRVRSADYIPAEPAERTVEPEVHTAVSAEHTAERQAHIAVSAEHKAELTAYTAVPAVHKAEHKRSVDSY